MSFSQIYIHALVMHVDLLYVTRYVIVVGVVAAVDYIGFGCH